MIPGEAGGLFGERLGNCSLRCSRQLLLHCSTFAHPWVRTSSIHGVVHLCSRRRRHTTVSCLKAADFSSFPLQGGRLGWGGNASAYARRSRFDPPPSPSPYTGGEILFCGRRPEPAP